MASDPQNFSTQNPAEEQAAFADEQRVAGRKTSVHRLQIGLFGLCAMALLVGLVGIIQNSAAETQAASVSTTLPVEEMDDVIAPMRDPLVDAGVVPELPAETTPSEEDIEQADPIEDMAEALGAESDDEQSSEGSD